MSTCTIALLSQPNAGKSTLFNGLTGARQHVGNWPGKTVEKKEGTFHYEGHSFTVVDLPGSYSLSANSDEEVVTRDYIASGEANLICILIDASQLERSLFMLADYAGINVPVVILLNMMDVAEKEGKTIKDQALQEALHVPVIPFVAADRHYYAKLYQLLLQDASSWILDDTMLTAFMREEFSDQYEQIASCIPASGYHVYARNWLISKLIEQDAPSLEIVKAVIDTDAYQTLISQIETINDGHLHTGNCKFRWIDYLLKEQYITNQRRNEVRGFDKLATSRWFGKPLAVILILFGLILSILLAMPLMMVSSLILQLSNPIASLMQFLHVPTICISLLTDGVLGAVNFALLMSSYVFGVSLVFGFMEEVGYMARISFVFDHTMRKLGLHGKAVMPFLVSFGCNIGGTTGTRVLDTWGQKVTTIALSWVVPCASTWAVVGLISTLFFGIHAIWVVCSMFLVAAIHMVVTAKLFGSQLLKEQDRVGLIMELPPYHKARWRSLFAYVLARMADVLKRALKIIILVSVIFWALAYSADGLIEHSLIYQIGVYIEPVTMWFGLRWQMFMAWLSSILGKESSLGVLSALFHNEGIWSAIINQKSNMVDTVSVGNNMLQMISKPEALAFLYAFFFNMPCLMALSSCVQETHSMKWTLRIAFYYIGTALLLAFAAYHIGLLLFS